MKNKIGILLLIAILLGLFSSCRNESGNIWAKYRSESFCTTLRYGQFDTEIYAKVNVERGETNKVTAEFSSPDALRGAVAVFDGQEYVLTCEGIELRGEAAKKLLNLPLMLAFAEAISFENQTENELRLLTVKTEDGEIIFDIDTGEPVRAQLNGISCDIIDFYWQEQAT